jgi:hypothetical protein
MKQDQGDDHDEGTLGTRAVPGIRAVRHHLHIFSEPKTWPHTPDWPLALGVEAAWLLFILVVGGGLSALIQKKAKTKK